MAGGAPSRAFGYEWRDFTGVQSTDATQPIGSPLYFGGYVTPGSGVELDVSRSYPIGNGEPLLSDAPGLLSREHDESLPACHLFDLAKSFRHHGSDGEQAIDHDVDATAGPQDRV